MRSRYAVASVLPDPDSDPSGWVDFLGEAGRSLNCRPAFIPTTDAVLGAVFRHAAQLSGSYACAIPPCGLLQGFMDKCSQYQLLEGAGAPLPHSAAVVDATHAQRAAADIGFPCLMKPNRGDAWTRRTGRKLELVRSREEAANTYEAMAAAGLGVLIQELIPGGDDALFGCICQIDAAGEVRACFTKRKIRQHPTQFGNGSYQVSAHLPEVAEITLALLRKVGYRGLAAAEFKRDARDGRLMLLEVNCRAVSGTQLAIDSGVDLPWLVYREQIGRPLDPVCEFTAGRSLINFAWDAREYLRSGDRSPSGFRSWAKSVAAADSDAVISWRDPGPALFGLLRLGSFRL